MGLPSGILGLVSVMELLGGAHSEGLHSLRGPAEAPPFRGQEGSLRFFPEKHRACEPRGQSGPTQRLRTS